MIGYMDTHCHLANPRLIGQVAAVIARANRAGVDTIICATAHIEECRQAADLAGRYPGVYCLAGIHPHDARLAGEGYLDRLAELAANPRMVAIGETGLDYHYDHSPRDRQRKVFAAQLELAGRLGKPVIVHTREAFDDTLAILADSPVPPQRVVLHSFSEGPGGAGRALALGMTLSFSGIVTFANAGYLRESARLAPDDRILTETDAPFLSPEPVRKMKTNEPANVVHVAAALARLRGQTLRHLAACVRQNAQRVFGIS